MTRLAFSCAACDWSVDAGPDPDVTVRVVNWHVYTSHPGIWRSVNGDEVPPDPWADQAR